ncbi:MAG: O-antigen ligase family protein [Chloroflexi bacterium]|nr:O-antigen ligase family protein [Chloroflexota bacterium]
MPKTLNDYLALGVRSAIVLILFAPLVVTQNTLFPYVVGKALYIRSLTEVAFALWVLLALRDNRYWLPRSWLIILFALYVIANVISALLGVSFQRSFWGDVRRMGGVFDLIHWFMLLLVMASMWRSTRQWRWLLNANLGVSLVLSILGIAQSYGVRLLWFLKETGRVDVTFGNADYVGAYAIVNMLIALAFLANSFAPKPLPAEPEPARRPQRRAAAHPAYDWTLAGRVFWILTILVNMWVLSVSGTRGALAGLIAALLVAGVVYAVFGMRKRLRIGAGALAACIVAVVMLMPVAHEAGLFKGLADSNALVRRLDETFEGGIGQAYQSRRVIVEAGVVAFAKKPVFGWGPENFSVAYDRYGKEFFGEQIADQAHSKPVEELTTKGIVGLGLYLGIVFVGLWTFYRKLRREPQEELLTLFLGAAFVAYVVQNLFLFDTPGTYVSFAVLLAWVAANEYTAAGRVAQPDPVAVPSRRQRRALAAQQAQQGDPSAAPQWQASFRTLPAFVVSAVVVGSLTLFSLYWFNARIYSMTADFPVQGQSLDGFVKDAQKSFDEFPALATLPRVFLMDTVAANWVRAKGTPELLGKVMEEGEAALASEPENARIYVSLARLMQEAAAQHSDVLKDSRSLLEKARALAPDLPSVLDAEQQQKTLEERLGLAATSTPAALTSTAPGTGG